MSEVTRRRVDAGLDSVRGGRAEIEGEGCAAEVQTGAVGPVGVEVKRLRVEGKPGPVDVRARAISESFRPKGERLVEVEVDTRLGGAVLRTQPGDMRRGRFFEVELDEQGVEVRRLRREGSGRQQEVFPLTREELGEWIDELGEALNAASPVSSGG